MFFFINAINKCLFSQYLILSSVFLSHLSFASSLSASSSFSRLSSLSLSLVSVDFLVLLFYIC
jgi:hypothetical protein